MSKARKCLMVLWGLMAFPGLAWAYLDMGTGAYLGQLLIALVAGVVMFVRHPMETLKAWWRRLRGRIDE